MPLHSSRVAGGIAAAVLAFNTAGRAVPVLTTGHVDIGIGYDQAAFDLHLHDETAEIEYAPNEAILGVVDGARRPLPDSLATALGAPPGSPMWILPAVQDPALLFLGLGAEELDPTAWVDPIRISLIGLAGPGSIAVWSAGSLGSLEVHLNSRDGISAGDVLEVLPGSHAHEDWGFSVPGEYTVTLEASGTHRDDGAIVSGPVEYHFLVMPEPGSLALILMGAPILWTLSRRTGAGRNAP